MCTRPADASAPRRRLPDARPVHHQLQPIALHADPPEGGLHALDLRGQRPAARPRRRRGRAATSELAATRTAAESWRGWWHAEVSGSSQRADEDDGAACGQCEGAGGVVDAGLAGDAGIRGLQIEVDGVQLPMAAAQQGEGPMPCGLPVGVEHHQHAAEARAGEAVARRSARRSPSAPGWGRWPGKLTRLRTSAAVDRWNSVVLGGS